ncbi:MAG: hypothetical protein GY758_19025, partial [Fuerstiella sp.]|nr:hypothetical protein [Fuerstiella sp.]
MEIQAGDAVTYFDAPAGVEFTGTVKANRVTTTNLTASLINENPSTTNPNIVPHSGVLNTGIGLGPNDGGYALSLIAGSVEGIRIKASGDVIVAGTLSAGILSATAQAITDTPLSVAGAVGHTADLATFGSGARVTAAEEFSNPGSAAGSESFGAGASCTAADGLAVGPDA